MLYGYRESIDNRSVTIVSAADSILEYDQWIDRLTAQSPLEYFVEFGTSTLADHMFKDEFKGFKRPVIIVYHDGDAQRDQFFNIWHIVNVKTENARDRQKDMMFLKQREDLLKQEADEDALAQEEGREVVGRSIEEIYGLDKEDRWDRRTEDQKKHDNEIKAKMKDLQKRGNLSGDSFGSAAEQRKARAEARGEIDKTDNGALHISDIRSKTNKGVVEIDSIIARKTGGDVDTPTADKLKTKNKRIFSPEDFAAVLAGDGSADHINIPSSADANKMRREPGSKELNLSPAAMAARKEYQDEQAALAKATADIQRIEDDKTAKKEHDNGIFRGCDLNPDQIIDVDELPQVIRELLVKNNILDTTFPLKDYPYNSQLGDHVLLPNDGITTERPMRIATTVNLDIIGSVSMDEPSVTIAKKTDATLAGWAIYARKKLSDNDTDDIYGIYVVRIR